METITDRAQVYWDTLDPNFIVDADHVFDIARGRNDMGEDIKYIRGFLTKKYNRGEAFLIPNQSPPTYQKLEKPPSLVGFCTMLFNALPEGERISTLSFNNRLPLKMKDKKGVSNFLYRARQGGATVHVLDEHQLKEKDGKCYIFEKRASILDLPTVSARMTTVAREAVEMIKEVHTETETMTPEAMASKIFDMKASDVGMSIFELLHKLMKENKEQTELIEVLKETLSSNIHENSNIVESYNLLLKDKNSLLGELSVCKDALKRYQEKDKTYGEIFGTES